MCVRAFIVECERACPSERARDKRGSAMYVRYDMYDTVRMCRCGWVSSEWIARVNEVQGGGGHLS